MLVAHRTHRTTWITATALCTAALLCAAALCSATASAQPAATPANDKLGCAVAHRDAQVARRDGQLRRARELLLACSDAACPALVVDDCRPWLEEIQAQIPTLVIETQDGAGSRLATTITLDGEVRLKHGSRIVLPVDPGRHRIALRRDGYQTVEREVVANMGAGAIAIIVTLKPQPTSSRPRQRLRPGPVETRPPADNTSPSVATWIVAGLSVAALGLFVGFGASGLSRRGKLDDSGCAPSCKDDDVAAMDRDFLIADISLGAGLGLGAIAAVLLFTTGSHNDGSTTTVSATIGPHSMGLGIQSAF